MAAELMKEYDTTMDSKCRITVRGQTKDSLYKNYHVKIYKDGHIVLEPRVLVHPDQISEKTLKMMDSAMENYAKGNHSESVDLNEMGKLADELPD
jgi:hypothetical protein